MIGDRGTVFKACKELQGRRKGKGDGSTFNVAMPELEREAWKEHFSSISKGRGSVHEDIWSPLGPAEKQQFWMGDVPDDDEIARAIKNMKNDRAAGDDGVAAESLKYGGPRLQQEVCTIVKEMWVKASLSEYGHEADDWPSEWKVAIQVPLWKRKGQKKDKTLGVGSRF